MAAWLACYVAAYVAGCSWVAAYELASLWLAWLPATWWLMADEMAGWPPADLVVGHSYVGSQEVDRGSMPMWLAARG